MKELLSREEQESKCPQDTWDLTSIFENDKEFVKAFKSIEKRIGEEEKFVNNVGNSSETLYEVLSLEDEIDRQLEKLYVYAHLKHDQDTTNDKYKRYKYQVQELTVKLSSNWSFIMPEILKIDKLILKQYILENEKLQRYQFDLEKINEMRPHILDVQTEALLIEAQEPMNTGSNMFNMFNNADITFEDVEDENGEKYSLTQGSFLKYLESGDRLLRQSAYHNLYKAYSKFNNTLGAALTGNIKKNIFNARIQNYDSARHAALSQNYIPEEIYDNLITTVHKYLPLLHRYVSLRKELLGINNLRMYDMYTPLVQDMNFKIPYKKAEKWILEALKPMGEEYLNVVREGLNNRWIDVYENKGKVSGGYSSGSHLTNPFILLNWSETINDLYTLIHEIGHSVHSYFSRKNQPSNASDYSVFLAEVASTCNEALLSDYMDKNLDKKGRLFLLNKDLDRFRATLFRQTMFAEFEHKIYTVQESGEPLTAARMNREYADLNHKYYGPDLEIDDEIVTEWSRVPHFYTEYYVYQYATGYSAAQSLSTQILSEGKPAAERYINEFLKKGGSNYPIKILENSGVHMRTPRPIEDSCKIFEKKLNEFEKIIKEK